jgi:hypothetical protein
MNMGTKLLLDDRVIAESAKVGKHDSSRDAIIAALLHYIRQHGGSEPRIVDLFGKVDFRDDWDYKAERARNG